MGGDILRVDLRRMEDLGLLEPIKEETVPRQSGRRLIFALSTAAVFGLSVVLIGNCMKGTENGAIAEVFDLTQMAMAPSDITVIDLDEEADLGFSFAEEEPEPAVVESKEMPSLALPNVENVLSVRADNIETAARTGVLYKDSLCTVINQSQGWTKIESGDVIGWVPDESLVFDEEMEEKAKEAATCTAIVQTASLNVRADANTESEILTSVKENEELLVAKVTDDGWALVAFDDGTEGYVSTDYVGLDFSLDTGDSMETILTQYEDVLKEREPETTATVTSGESMSYGASDLDMLAAIIYCEAGNQPYEGKVAVGNVVLNRVRSSRFPGSISEVLNAAGQFSPVISGKFNRILNSGRVPESCYQAAQDAFDGISFVGDCLFFKNPKIAGAHAGIMIGDHVFW